MGWIDALEGTVVGLDTAPLIYFIEAHPLFLPAVKPFFQAVDQGRIQVVTSVITVTEVLVQPLRFRSTVLADSYRSLLHRSKCVRILDVTPEIAENAAVLRAQFGLRTPDAIQLATAQVAGAAAFLTNDHRLAQILEPRIIILKPAGEHSAK